MKIKGKDKQENNGLIKPPGTNIKFINGRDNKYIENKFIDLIFIN